MGVNKPGVEEEGRAAARGREGGQDREDDELDEADCRVLDKFLLLHEAPQVPRYTAATPPLLAQH